MPAIPTSNSPRFRFTLHCELLESAVLRADPKGWDALGISLHRDPVAHGLATEFTVQLGFVKDGRAYLRRAYDAAGIEANVRLEVEQYDPNGFDWEPYYTGRVNLTDATFTRLECTARVENEDFTQKFLNRDSVLVDLFGEQSVGGSAGPYQLPTRVSLHSRSIVRRFEGTVSNPGGLLLPPGLVIDGPSRSQTFYFGYSTLVSNEIGLQQIAGGFVSGDAFSAVPIYYVPDSGEYLIEFGGIVDVAVRSPAGGTVGEFGSFNAVDVKFHYRINGSPPTALVLASHSTSAVAPPNRYAHRFIINPQSFTEPLNPGDRIYLYAEVYTHDIDPVAGGAYQFEVTAVEQPGTYLRIKALTRTEATSCAGLLPFEAFDRICQALTDAPDAFRSSFFGRPDTRQPQPVDGEGALTLLTSGFQVRGFPLLSAPAPAPGGIDSRKSLYASWRELFGSYSAVYGLGYGQERSAAGRPVVRVEPWPYFYPERVVLDFSVSTPTDPAPTVAVSTKVLADRHFQGLEFGYATWQAEQVNGLEEANTKRQWTTPLTQVNSTYSQVSKYATSGQLLEVTRRARYVDSDTTDNRTDNNNFLVCLLRRPDGSLETERDQRFTFLGGVLDPASIYNARLTPARNLRRHGGLVRAGLEPAATRRVRFGFGEGNNALVSQLVGEAVEVAENADILVRELAPPLWRPEADTFTAPLRREQLRTLLADRHARIRYRDEAGQLREGWILDFKHAGAQQLGEFTLLPCLTLSPA